MSKKQEFERLVETATRTRDDIRSIADSTRQLYELIPDRRRSLKELARVNADRLDDLSRILSRELDRSRPSPRHLGSLATAATFAVTAVFVPFFVEVSAGEVIQHADAGALTSISKSIKDIDHRERMLQWLCTQTYSPTMGELFAELLTRAPLGFLVGTLLADLLDGEDAVDRIRRGGVSYEEAVKIVVESEANVLMLQEWGRKDLGNWSTSDALDLQRVRTTT
jgi:hypothetical protein